MKSKLKKIRLLREVKLLFFQYLEKIRVISALISSVLIYVLFNKNQNNAHILLINGYVATHGKSNNYISYFIKVFGKKQIIFSKPKIMPYHNDLIDRASIELEKSGIYIFEHKLDSGSCKSLMNFALTQQVIPRLADIDSDGGQRTSHLYNRDCPVAVRHDFILQDLLNNIEIQKIITDKSILSVAERYLGATPIFDSVSMWWQSSINKLPDREAAQEFHFDMERFKWIKFFIYLTDVTNKNGPHVFIPGTHRSNGVSKEVTKLGYVRLSDDLVNKFYPRSNWIEVTGACGTIFAEDTRGLHKGKIVESGDRLVLQIQYSNCHYGVNYLSQNLKINTENNDFISSIKANQASFRPLMRSLK